MMNEGMKCCRLSHGGHVVCSTAYRGTGDLLKRTIRQHDEEPAALDAPLCSMYRHRSLSTLYSYQGMSRAALRTAQQQYNPIPFSAVLLYGTGAAVLVYTASDVLVL